MSKKMRKFVISVVVLLISIAVIVAVIRIPVDEEVLPPQEAPPVNVEILKLAAQAETTDILELPGSMEPRLIVEVPAEVRGSIEEVYFQEGQSTREGDLILRLDDELYQAEFDRVEAQLEFDERAYERSRALLEKGVLNRSEVEEVEARMRVSRANYRVAQTNLDRTRVYSPIGGVLNQLLVERGEYVAPGDPVAEIVDSSSLEMVVQVPERDIHFVKVGTRIEVTVDALEGRRRVGQITYVSEVADESTRTTRVEIMIDNSRDELHSGMIARAKIPRRTLRNVLMIPLSAVIPLEEGRVVYVAEEGKALRRHVQLGVIRGSQVQVLDGLHPGESLVVAGHRQVGPGQNIRVVERRQ